MTKLSPGSADKTVYFPHIDGLRAVAVLAVVIYHLNAKWLPGGFAGVDVFFVISGFIVSASVGSLKDFGLLKFIPFFYARRLQRIGPALVVCLVLTTLASALLIPSAWLSQTNQQTGMYAFFGLSNLILARTNNDYFSPIVDFNPFTHTWSLGVEEQFYFVFPLLFFAWTFRGEWRRFSTFLFAFATVASLCVSAHLGVTDKTSAYYMITSRFWQLGAGVVLYQLMVFRGLRFDAEESRRGKWSSAGAVLSLVLLGASLVLSNPSAFPFPGAIPCVMGALGILGFMHSASDRNPAVRLLSSRPFIFVGRISYSLYLWHWPVFVFFRWTVGLDLPIYQFAALFFSFALAIASFYFVETPCRRLPALRVAPRIVVAMLGLIMVGTAALVARQIDAYQPKISLSTVTRNAADWYPDGSNTDPKYPNCVVSEADTPVSNSYVTAFTRSNCSGQATAPRIFAIGDSHAAGHTSMFREYVLKTGAPVFLYNNAGCPFLSLQPWREDSNACMTAANGFISDFMAKARPGDVLFLPSLRLPRYGDQWIRGPEGIVQQAVFGGWAVKARSQATAQAISLLKQFEFLHVRVVIEAPTPIFKSPTFRCAENYDLTNPICRDGTEMNRALLERLRQPTLDAFSGISKAVPIVSVWDPFPILCPPGETCSAFKGGRPLFFDADHISGFANRMLLPSFITAVLNK